MEEEETLKAQQLRIRSEMVAEFVAKNGEDHPGLKDWVLYVKWIHPVTEFGILEED